MSGEVKGGDKLGPAMRDLAAKLGNAESVDVGFPGGATYPNGTPVAMVAAIQEYGAPKVGVPPRPYFRSMIASKSPEWPKAVAALLKTNDFDAHATLDQAGQAIAGQLQDSIAALQDPPLSPVTLMLRKMVGPNGQVTSYKQVIEARARVAAGEGTGGVSTKPLVWTGKLLNSVTYVVK